MSRKETFSTEKKKIRDHASFSAKNEKKKSRPDILLLPYFFSSHVCVCVCVCECVCVWLVPDVSGTQRDDFVAVITRRQGIGGGRGRGRLVVPRLGRFQTAVAHPIRHTRHMGLEKKKR